MNRLTRSPFFKFGTWWLFWTLVSVWPFRQFGFSWTLAIVDSTVTQLDWAIAAYVVSQVVLYYRPTVKNMLNIIVLCLALAALFTLGVLPWLLPRVVPFDPGYEKFLDASLPVRFIIAWMQLLYVATISWMWYFVQEREEAKKREEDASRLVKEAELSQLRQQLQPHFLFNSLNSINALVGSQPEQARSMIQQLSDFLRGTVKKDDRQRVMLEDELEHLQLYLDIEKVRFGYRLKSVVEADDEARALMLPPLLLQPIVENAIKFGLYDTIGEITITLKAKKENNLLVVQVTNPFDPTTSRPKQGTGFGLSSISRRLYLIYSQNNLLETSANENIFTTTIKIPQA